MARTPAKTKGRSCASTLIAGGRVDTSRRIHRPTNCPEGALFRTVALGIASCRPLLERRGSVPR
jgi:hypothetical protein